MRAILLMVTVMTLTAAGCGDDGASTEPSCVDYCTRISDCYAQDYDACVFQCEGGIDGNPADCRAAFLAFNDCAEPVTCNDLQQGVCDAEVQTIVAQCPFVP